MTETEQSTELVLAHTGELVNLEDVTQVAKAYEGVREIKNRLVEAERILREAFALHARLQGTKTIYVEGVGKFEVKNSERTEFPDPLALAEELRKVGCPEEVIDEIVITKITYTVDARRAARAASVNPDYAEVISRMKVVQEKTPWISTSS